MKFYTLQRCRFCVAWWHCYATSKRQSAVNVASQRWGSGDKEKEEKKLTIITVQCSQFSRAEHNVCELLSRSKIIKICKRTCAGNFIYL